MSLAAGTRLGPYEVLGSIGAGGMGEVYKARDTRLDRAVAIKVLPERISADPERRARLEREARTIATLAHPHICTLHDVGEHDGSMFLVMEHLDGESLERRIERGPIPIPQALAIAAEVADALSAAHRAGIIHRDLKPGNVMLTKSGAKLLDFGLAKLTEVGGSAGVAKLVPESTRSAPLTAQGVILGTLPYMAPEQLEGKPVDARTDLWALGAILYEMVSGHRAFNGTSAASVIAAILQEQPAPLASQQPGAPSALGALLRRCLAKDPEDRWDTAHDVAGELRYVAWQVESGQDNAGVSASTRKPRRFGWAVAVIAAVALVGSLSAMISGLPRGTAGPLAPTRLVVPLDPAEYLQDSASAHDGQPLRRTAIALSPDGRLLVFAGVGRGAQQLYLRQLDQLESTPIPGTAGGANPFFSPDGNWLGFWADGALRKVPTRGGPPVAICSVPLPFGASWGTDDRIVFSVGGGLSQVSASGGQPEQLTAIDFSKGEVSHRLPHVLPDGEHVLFTVTRSRSPKWDQTRVVLYSRRTRTTTAVLEGGADARYVATGHLVFVRDGALMASPFDIHDGGGAGGAVGLVSGLMQAAYAQASVYDSGAGQFAISDTGILAYVPGAVVPDPMSSLMKVDRTGRERVLSEAPRPFTHPRVSPDGSRIAVATTGRNRDIWIYDVRRGVPIARLTSDGLSGTPVWAAEGKRVIYRTGRMGPDNLFSQPAEGAAGAERLSTSRHNQVPATCSPDGKTIILYDLGEEMEAVTGWRLLALSAGADAEPTPVIDTNFALSGADLSSDGRWLAYASNETGRREVYVQPFGRPGARLQVSTGGGMSPVWRRDGRELFYIEPDSRESGSLLTMMVVAVTTTPVLSVGTPTSLFTGRYAFGAPARHYDVTPDGQHFVLVRGEEPATARVTRVMLVQNWFAELMAKVPAM